MEELLKLLAQGPVGIIAALAIWVAWKKDQQLKSLYENTLVRSEKMLDRYHMAVASLNETLHTLVEFEKQNEKD